MRPTTNKKSCGNSTLNHISLSWTSFAINCKHNTFPINTPLNYMINTKMRFSAHWLHRYLIINDKVYLLYGDTFQMEHMEITTHPTPTTPYLPLDPCPRTQLHTPQWPVKYKEHWPLLLVCSANDPWSYFDILLTCPSGRAPGHLGSSLSISAPNPLWYCNN